MEDNYKTILEWFVGHDKIRPSLMTPFSNEDYCFATDAHKLIAIPKTIITLAVDRDEPALSKKAVEMIVKKPYREYPINTQYALDVFNPHINLIDELDKSGITECDKCQGEGEVECPCCGNLSECPDCRGTGELGRVIKTGRKIPNPEQRFLINNVKFKSCNILPVFNAAQLLNVNTINWVVSEAESANVFKVGDVSIVVMPMMQTYEDDKGTTIKL